MAARNARRFTAALCAAGTIAFAGCAPFGRPVGQGPADDQTAALPTPPAEVAGAQSAVAPANAAAQVYRQAGPSVVNVTSLAVVRSPFGAPFGASPAGQPAQPQPRGTGSGFVIDNEGHIVTNNHVVEEADQLGVTFPDRTAVPATLVGRDPENDLAVIRVDPNAKDENGRALKDLLRPVTLGDSDRIVTGEIAIAIGSPLGLQQTVTSGIVSAVRLPSEEIAGGEPLLLGGAVQTDAAINPGNSGGPLFNAAGEVIGVNTAGLAPAGGSIGLNFAIPVNVVKRVVPELISRGCYRHPLIGVSALPLSQIGQSARRELDVPVNQAGLLVQEVSAGAADAGIRAGQRTVTLGGAPLRAGGDIVIAVDGRRITSGGELRAYVENNKRPGDAVALTVLRDGQRRDVRVMLSERPSEACR
jgi:S1-C subfamily serine protease